MPAERGIVSGNYTGSQDRRMDARKLGIRMWIMLRNRMEYNEFCRRGQMQQKTGDACAGMPEARYGAKVTR